ncbi:hypothetical protein E4U41_002035 [Claviceps citrina]|nr:hypothetical protein E4U41_002035 [Claviceps citrina]
MDSFMRAAKSGLAKTVAAGQQHLQQRLAKYEQAQSSQSQSSQSQSQSQPQSQSQLYPGGNSYSTGQHPHGQQPAPPAQYYHGNQSQHQQQNQQHQSQAPAVQHSQYIAPPPPTSTTQQGQHHQHGCLAPPSQRDSRYYPPLGQQSYGHATSPYGQGQYASYVAPPPPPPPPPPRPYEPSAGTNNALSSQLDSAPDQAASPASAAIPTGADRLPSQQAASSSISPQGSQHNTAIPMPPNTLFTPLPPPPLPPPPPQSSTHAQVQSYPDAHASPVPPPPPTRTDYSQQLQPQSEPQPHGASTAAEHPDPNHWTNRLRRAQESLTTFIPSYRPDASLHGRLGDAQAAGGNGSQTPVTSAVNKSHDAGIPPPLLPVAEATQGPVAGATPWRDDGAQAYTTGFANEPNHDTYQASGGDDTAAISQIMSALSIENEKRGPAQFSAERPSKGPKARQLPPVVASGRPRDVVRYCPEDRVVDYPLYWYQLPDEPEFLICTRCHQDHIKSTRLEGRFKRILAEPGSQSACRFWSPRVKDCLWKNALESNDVGELRAFMKRRLSIPNCKGRCIVTGKENVKWFGMVNDDIKGFIVCEACYEDKIAGTRFQSQFVAYREQGLQEEWTCDAALPYVARAIEKMAKNNDWSGFVSSAGCRMGYPACEGKDIAWNEGVWFAPRRKLDNFYVCGACYMDKLALTAFEREFDSVATTVGFDAWMTMLGTRWTCKLPSSNIPMSFTLETYLADEDFDGFWNMASVVSPLVPCTANGIIRGNWWTIAGGCPDFSICEACYNGVFKSSSLDKFLEPATRSAEETIVCSFCPAAPRFNQYIRKFAEAMDRGVFSYYADYIKAFAHVPACPRLDHRENSTWWGYDQALFCQDCYLSFVADTRLGPHLQYHGASDARAQICQMWSPRMRRLWLEVCDAGAPASAESNDALDKFKAFAQRRLEVFLQTIPRIKFIRGMKEIRMMNAMHQGRLSLMYSGMNGMAVLSDTTDGYAHGNSSLGWYETEHGATGAQMFNNMQAGFADANRTDEWAQIVQLQMMWSEVE